MIQPTVLTLPELHDKARDMQIFLEEKYDSKEGSVLIERMEVMQRLMAESGKCLADAKWYKEKIENDAIMESLKKSYEEKLSTSTINKYVTTVARDYNYLVNVFDRINASATHQSDALRTLLSYLKAQMTMQ